MLRSNWSLIHGRRRDSQGTKRRARSVVGVKRRLSFDYLEERSLLSGGVLDPSFDVDGKVTTNIAGVADQAKSVAIQPDGKIVVAGVALNGANNDFAVARYNSNGTPDTSFSTDGKVTIDFGGNDDRATSVLIQPDGSIIVAGVSINGGSGDFAVARLDTLGNLDTSFGTGGKVTTDFGGGDDRATSAALQADGKIVLAGFAVIAGGTDFAVARYNTNGSLDANFDADGRVTTDFGSGTDQGNGVAIQLDGRIVVVGTTDIGGNNDFALVRYNADGSLHTNFGIGGGVATDFTISDDVANAVAIQRISGKIIVAGTSDSGGGGNNFALASYNSDGTLNTIFSGDGIATLDFSSGNDQAFGVRFQANGKIVVAGASDGAGNNNFALALFNLNGSLDSSFGTGGRVLTDFAGGSDDQAFALALQLDGKIVVAGVTATDFAVARYSGEGPDILVTGADAGPPATVHVYDAAGLAELCNFPAYAATFRGGVRVAAGDVNGDGTSDIITAPGVGMGPTIQVFDGGDCGPGLPAGSIPDLLGSFPAYDPKFRGGVYVAVGDVNNDGTQEIITGPDKGKGLEPRVKVFNGVTGVEICSFRAFDAKFRGGVRVAAADMNADGIDDVIAGAGPGGSPEIRIFNGATFNPGNPDGCLQQFAPNEGRIIAFNPAFRGGVFVAAGDFNGDGKPDIIAGAGRVAPRVKVFFMGRDNPLIADFSAAPNSSNSANATNTSNTSNAANFRRGVRVAALDVNSDGRAEIITGAGPGHGPLVLVFDFNLTLATSPGPDLIFGTADDVLPPVSLSQVDSFFTDDLRFNHGVFVAATHR